MVAHQNRRVDGDGAGAGLGDGRQVQHFLLLNPVEFLQKALAHQGDDYESAPEGAGAELEGGEEQLPILVTFVQGVCLLLDVAQVVVLHAQVDSAQLEGLGQRQNPGVGSYILLHGILEGLLEGGPGLEAHASGDAGLLGTHNVDGGGVHLRDMAAAHHGEAMEGMEGVGEAILANILLVGGEVLAVAVHIRQSVHMVMLEHFVQLPQIGPALVVEIAVADGGADDHAVVLHHPLVANDLGGQGLHHLDGVGTHAVAVMEILGHAEDHHVVLLLGKGHIGALVGDFPALGHHHRGIAGVDGNLAGVGIQHRVAAEEGMAHLLLHVHADFVELGPHQAVAGDRSEVLPVHDLGHMVGGDAPPMGNARGAVLVAAGVATIGVALDVADEDGNVAVEDILVHEHRVAPLGGAQVYHMLRVLGIVAGDLVGPVELVKELLAQNLPHLALRGAGVQAVGEQQQNVLFANTAGVQLL